MAKLTGLHAVHPCHRLRKIEEEAAHVDKAPIDPTIWAWSLRERSLRLTGHMVRERDDSEQTADEGAHSFIFSRTLTVASTLQIYIGEITSTVKPQD